MPLIVSDLFQMLVPGGMMTVSPGCDDATALLTATNDPLAALIVADRVRQAPSKNRITANKKGAVAGRKKMGDGFVMEYCPIYLKLANALKQHTGQVFKRTDFKHEFGKIWPTSNTLRHRKTKMWTKLIYFQPTARPRTSSWATNTSRSA